MADIIKNIAPSNTPITCAQLTAATQATESVKLISDDGLIVWKNVIAQIQVAGISTNVVVRLRGSLDNVNWFNLDEGDSDITYTANGTFGIQWEGYGDINYVDLYFVSEAGGTAATLDVQFKVFGGRGGI